MICLTYIQAQWDSYIEDLISESKDPSGHESADQGAIVGLNGGDMWTADVSMKMFTPVRQFSAFTWFRNIHVIPITDCGSYESKVSKVLLSSLFQIFPSSLRIMPYEAQEIAYAFSSKDFRPLMV